MAPVKKTVKAKKAEVKIPKVVAPNLAETDVLAWLQAYPAFITRHAAKLHAPVKEMKKAGNITPLHAARADKAETKHDHLKKTQQRLVRTVQANSATAADVFDLLPHMVRCTSLASFRKFTQTTLKTHLQVEATRLVLAGPMETATSMTEDAIAALCPHPATLRTLYDVQDRSLYGNTGKMLKSDCLLRLRAADGTTLGMLAIASNDDQRFHPGQATELAALIGSIASAVLENALQQAAAA
ncbi:MAG: DUF484 family protein [Alphaproteobacteria bacterium]